MDKVIMLPTDFSVESLNTLKLAIDQYEGNKVRVLLVYAENPSDSITELLFYNPYNTIRKLRSKTFDEALAVLKNRYESSIESLCIKVFHGTTTSALKSFVEANQIDEILLPKSYQFKLPKNGFDLTPIVKKSKLPYQELGWENAQGLPNQMELNILFNIN
jgi:hypothetical protein